MPAVSFAIRTALACLLASAGCGPGSRWSRGAARTVAEAEPADADAAATQELPANVARLADQHCPLTFAHSDVILARVGDTRLTACDVALAAATAAREGRPPIDPRVLLDELVDAELLATEARARGLSDEPRTAARVRETLAAALVRSEALAALGTSPTEPAAPSDSTAPTEDRLHLREVVLADEAAARAVIADAARVPFAALVRERTVSAEGRRDEGDLGLVPLGGNDRVAPALVAAAAALAQPGDVAPEPVMLESAPVQGRRRRRVRLWHVVQLLARIPAASIAAPIGARSAQHRRTAGPYAVEHAAARDALEQRVRASASVAIYPAALARVRLRRDDPPAP